MRVGVGAMEGVEWTDLVDKEEEVLEGLHHVGQVPLQPHPALLDLQPPLKTSGPLGRVCVRSQTAEQDVCP